MAYQLIKSKMHVTGKSTVLFVNCGHKDLTVDSNALDNSDNLLNLGSLVIEPSSPEKSSLHEKVGGTTYSIEV